MNALASIVLAWGWLMWMAPAATGRHNGGLCTPSFEAHPKATDPLCTASPYDFVNYVIGLIERAQHAGKMTPGTRVGRLRREPSYSPTGVTSPSAGAVCTRTVNYPCRARAMAGGHVESLSGTSLETAASLNFNANTENCRARAPRAHAQGEGPLI